MAKTKYTTTTATAIEKICSVLFLSEKNSVKDMEDKLGKQLMIRGNRKITQTEKDMILRKRAEEI